MIIAFILLFLLCICIIELVKNKKVYSPIFVFNFIWLITIGLYQLKISTLQQDLSNRTLLIFIISILSYNILCFAFKYIKLKKTNFNLNIKPNKLKRKTIEEKVKIAKWIAILVFVIEIIYSGGLPLIWKLTGSLKTYYDFGIPSLNGAWYGLIICLGAYSCLKKGKDKYIYLLIGILILSRQMIISLIVEAVFFAILDKKQKINLKKIGIILLVVMIMFVGFNFLGNLRSGNNTMDEVFYPKQGYENLPTSIKWIYSYMTFSISNFNNLVSMTDGGVNHGTSMISEIAPTVIEEIINLEPNYNPYYLVLKNFTVSTYLPSAYLDFGLFGVALINIIIACIGMNLYKKYNINPDIKHRLVYAVFLHNIIFLFFINMFLYLPIIVQFLYIWIIFEEEKEEGEKNKNITNFEKLSQKDITNTKVSVAMATYNGEKYIKQQIESILLNLSEGDELIISDDGSTDRTLEIVEEFIQEDNKIKLINGPQKRCKAKLC